ncbi:MAG: hypothetical protein ACRCV3_00060 [Desulfovibrionaceae bacterium]
MGSKSLTFTLKNIYTSIYKATTIPLVCTSLIIGTSLLPIFPNNTYANQEQNSKTSLIILQSINNSLLQQYTPLPTSFFNNSNSSTIFIAFSANTVSKEHTHHTINRLPISSFSPKTPLPLFPFTEKVQGEFLTQSLLHNKDIVFAEDYIADPSFYEPTVKTPSYRQNISSIPLITQAIHPSILCIDSVLHNTQPAHPYITNQQITLARNTINFKKITLPTNNKEYFSQKDNDTIVSENNIIKVPEKTKNSSESQHFFPRKMLQNMPQVRSLTINSGQDITTNPTYKIIMADDSTVRLLPRTYTNFEIDHDNTNNHILFSDRDGEYLFSKAFEMGGGVFHADVKELLINNRDLVGYSFEAFRAVNVYLSAKEIIQLGGTLRTSTENDTIYLNNVKTGGHIQTNRGDDHFTLVSNNTGSNIWTDSGNDTIIISGNNNHFGEIYLGEGNDSLHLNNNTSLTSHLLTFDSGNNRLYLGQNAILTINSITFGNGADQFHILGSIDTRQITMGDGNDTITFTSSGRFLNSISIDLGAGNDYFTIATNFHGAFSPGVGNDTVNISSLNTNFTASNTISVSSGSSLTFSGRGSFSFPEIRNSGTLIIHLQESNSQVSGNITGNGNANITMENGATFRASSITFGNLADTLVLLNGGSFIGNANLGDGANNIRLNAGSLNGSLTTGIDSDTISLTRSTITGSLSIRGGNNKIELLDKSTLASLSISTGQNTIQLRNSTVTGNISALGSENQNIHISDRSEVRGNIRLGSGHNLYVVEGNSSIIGGFTLLGGNDTILFQDTVSIAGGVHTGEGNNSLNLFNRSTVVGSFSSGNGNDIAFIRGSSHVQNDVSLGNGKNTFTLLEESSIGGSFSSGTGDDSILIDGRSTIGGSVHLGNGDNSIQIYGQSTVALLTIGSGSDRVVLDNKSAITTNLNLGDGNNRLEVKGSSSIIGDISAQNGNDSILIDAVSEIGGNVSLGHGDNTFSLDNQSSIAGTLTLGNGNDNVIIANQSALTTNLELHEGDNRLSLSKQSTITGTLTTLAGADTIIISDNSQIQQDVNVGAGNNTIHMTQGIIAGSLTGGNNNDSLVLTTFSVIEGGVNLGHGVNLVNLENNSTITGNLLMGLGNDSINVTRSSRITGDILAGQGNNTIYVTASSFINGKIETGDGADTITISDRSTVTGGIFAFNGNNNITIENNSSIDALTIGSGHDTIVINNNASSTREIVLGEGNNSLSVRQNSAIDGFVSGGSGADTLTLSTKSHITGNINLGNGTNLVHISDNSRIGGELRTGTHTDNITIMNSEIQGNIVTGNGNDTLILENIRITGGVRTITVGENNPRDNAVITLSNSIHFDSPGGMISLLEGTYLLTLNNVNFGNQTGITMTGRGNNTLEATGLLRNVGDILMGDGSAFINFRDVTSATGDIGNIVGGLLQDSVLLHNSDFFGNIDFRTSGTVADTLRLSGRTVLSTATGVNANGQIKIYTHDTSRIIGPVTLNDSSSIVMEGSSVLQQSFSTATDKLVTLRMGDKSSLMGDIITSPTANSRLTIDLFDESLLNSNIYMGSGNDSLRITFNNTARLTGNIDTGAGNDSLYVDGSTLSPIVPNAIQAGDGNDLVEFSRLHLTGAFDMGDGNNTLSIIGNTTLAGNTFLNTTETDLVQILNKSTLISHITVNGGSGTFVLTPETLLEGNIAVQGQNMALNLDNQSTLDGSASGGAGINTVTLKRAHISGSVLNPLAGTLSIDSRNSTISGDIISAGRGNFEIIDSAIENTLVVSHGGAELNALRSQFLRSITLTGNNMVTMSASTVTEGFSGSGGEGFFTFNDMTFLRGISLERGDSHATILNSSIDSNLVFNFNKNVTLNASNNTIIRGNIILSNPDNTAMNNITLQNAEVHGAFSAGRNSGGGTYTFNNIRIGGEVELSRGQSTINFNIATLVSQLSLYDTEGTISSSTIGGDIVFKGKSLLTIRNSEIFGELDFTSFMLKEQNITLDNSTFTGDISLGNVENSITFISTNVSGNVFGNINNDNITFSNSIISGSIDLAIGADDKITFLGRNVLLGKIRSTSVDIMGELYITSPTNSKVNVVLQTPTNSPGITLHEGGSIILNEGIVGDLLTFKGNLTITSASEKMFFLDTNFYTGETDRITFDVLSNVTGNPFGIVIKSHIVATGQADPMEFIPGIITTNGVPIPDPKLAGKYASIGGSIYSLLENEHIPGQWDLVLTGKNPVAHAYSAMLVSRRNYERILWSKVSQNAFTGALEATQNQYIYSDITKRKFADHISTWADVQYSNNATSTKQSISMVENLLAFSGGFNLERLELTPKDLISVGVFTMYGNSPITFEHTSLLGEYFNFGGELTGITGGVTAMWENIRGKAKRRLYISAGFWGTFYEHTVKNPFGYNDDTWNTYALNSVINAGYRIHIKRFTIVPQIELLHTFTKGLSMIASDNTLVKFADEHRITTRLLTLFAYNFDFGLQPFIKLTTEFPVLNTTTDNATSVAGDIYNYASQGNLYSAAFGINYNLEVKGILIKTFIDTSVHFGREKGIDASLGFSVRF